MVEFIKSGRWFIFLKLQTPEIIYPSENREVALGVIGKMVRIGPIVWKTRYFTGNVYKLIKSTTTDEMQFLPKEERDELNKLPHYLNPNDLNEFRVYEKVMNWSKIFDIGATYDGSIILWR